MMHTGNPNTQMWVNPSESAKCCKIADFDCRVEPSNIGPNKYRGNKPEVMKMAEGNKPLKKFRAGGIVATVWKNTQKNKQGEEFDVNSITIERTYKDGDDFKQTSSMKTNDLPKVALVSNLAYEFLTLKEEKEE